AVQDRQTSRYLLFDDKLQLCGRRKSREGEPELVRNAANTQPLAFSGIHVISPRLLKLMTEEGVFSIIDVYLRLVGAGEKILAFRADEYYWRDLGKPEDLTKAAEELRQEAFPGLTPSLLCRSSARRQPQPFQDGVVQLAPDVLNFLVLARRVHAIRQEHDEELPVRVHPDRRSREACVPEGMRSEVMPAQAAGGGHGPAERPCALRQFLG